MQGGPNKAGPNLYGVVGRTAGTLPGYVYSPAMQECRKIRCFSAFLRTRSLTAKGLQWNDDSLFEFLLHPRQTVPHTKMSYRGLKNEQERRDVIAYLKSVVQ